VDPHLSNYPHIAGVCYVESVRCQERDTYVSRLLTLPLRRAAHLAQISREWLIGIFAVGDDAVLAVITEEVLAMTTKTVASRKQERSRAQEHGLTPRWILDRIRRFNKSILNPIVLTFAGRRMYAVVRHVGRRSGQMYATPVVVEPTEDAFIIPLPYGSDVDWCRNVLAASRCTIKRNGLMYSGYEPVIVDRRAALPAFSGLMQLTFRLLGVREFLRVRRFSW
jgi:deazaflavin-dependent oxidoreductase (nitroreductase family)